MAKARTRKPDPRAAELAERRAFEAAIDALVHGDHGDPFALLGMHTDAPEGPLAVRSLQPHARAVWAIDADAGEAFELPRVHPAGLFAGAIEGRSERFRHRLRLDLGTETVEIDDPYRFPALLGEMDVYLFGEGNHLGIYERFGAHPMTMDGVDGVGFVVWAPSARRVSVVGPFNGWDGRRLPMRKRVECGAFELFVPGLGPGTLYKFEIKGPRGELLPLKADPFAFLAEPPPATASVVHGCPRPAIDDHAWMQARARAQARDRPISIYEVHLGSWMRMVEDGDRYLTYRELADRLVPYVEAMGFTHVELMPVSEFPFDGSWGYQPVGLYAPTSRFGGPEDFAHLVERFHRAGIGVLIDWVPGHFPSDAHGLAYFDGTHLYEHEDPRQGFHLDWNTLIYNYGRNEVRNFLTANALFWLDRFHIDGLRVDAVASMLYLDYSRKQGEWVPNRFGGRENLEAIDFMRRTNELVYGRHEGAITVAEESTAWPAVSQPVYLGGLGFGYKWNMGWMHDTLEYMRTDPLYRRYHHHEMTFGLLYAFSENFVLPLSHDEVVHGKGSLLGKMPGDRWQRFANLRAYYGFMWTHPGKKLLFMGGELAQEREWNHDHSLDWHLLAEPMHAGVQQLVRDLNRLYRDTPALFERDCEGDGFEWIDGGDADNCVLTYLRKGREPERPVVVACNFTPLVRDGYRVGVPLPGAYKERLNTDAALYGGSNVGNAGGVVAEAHPWHGRAHSIALTLPPLATVILERVPN
jgi:1,4-alpha-glucan branching enzyme